MSFVPRLSKFFNLLALWAFASTAFADRVYNLSPGVTPIGREVYHLHMTIFWICVGIGVIVFSVMLFAIIFHRKSLGVEAAKFHESTTIEIIWTIIPFLILIFMAIPATNTLLELEDVSDSDLTVKITGFMWRWNYEYVGENVSFMSNLATSEEEILNRDQKDEHYLLDVDNRLVLPIKKKIRFITTANDVIHSWWVPQLAVKKDAIPGFINEAWAKIEKPGIYRGQCAELCGARHAYMPIVVEAVEDEAFQLWLEEQKNKQS